MTRLRSHASRFDWCRVSHDLALGAHATSWGACERCTAWNRGGSPMQQLHKQHRFMRTVQIQSGRSATFNGQTRVHVMRRACGAVVTASQRAPHTHTAGARSGDCRAMHARVLLRAAQGAARAPAASTCRHCAAAAGSLGSADTGVSTVVTSPAPHALATPRRRFAAKGGPRRVSHSRRMQKQRALVIVNHDKHSNDEKMVVKNLRHAARIGRETGTTEAVAAFDAAAAKFANPAPLIACK